MLMHRTPSQIQEQGGDKIIVITDGEETCGDDEDVQEAIREAQDAGITVSIIGFGLSPTEEKSLSHTVTSAGAKYYSAKDLSNLRSSLRKAASGDSTCCCAPLLVLVPLTAVALGKVMM